MHIEAGTAAAIPPELFEHIIRHVCGAADGTREQKRRVSLCGQVCRYWAKQCRPRLFRSIRLTCADDARTFWAVLQSSMSCPLPITPLYCLIRQLTVLADVGCAGQPWLHLISKHALQSAEIVELIWRPTSHSIPESAPFRGLPRRLPRSQSPYTTLELKGVRFKSDVEFLRLFHTLPALRDISLYDLKFDIPPRPDAFLRSRCLGPSLRSLSTGYNSRPGIGAISAAWLLPAFVARERAAPPQHMPKYALDPDDCRTVFMLGADRAEGQWCWALEQPANASEGFVKISIGTSGCHNMYLEDGNPSNSSTSATPVEADNTGTIATQTVVVRRITYEAHSSRDLKRWLRLAKIFFGFAHLEAVTLPCVWWRDVDGESDSYALRHRLHDILGPRGIRIYVQLHNEPPKSWEPSIEEERDIEWRKPLLVETPLAPV